MPRGLTTNQLAALAQPRVSMAVLAALAFTNETLYVWSGLGDLIYGGNTYRGIGSLGKIAVIAETDRVSALATSLSLSGIDPANLDIAEVMASMSVKNTVALSIVLFDDNNNVIDGPIASCSGFMDQASIEESAEGSMIKIDIENRLAQLNRPAGWFLCDADVRFWNPNEGAFQWTSYLEDYTFRFGN